MTEFRHSSVDFTLKQSDFVRITYIVDGNWNPVWRKQGGKETKSQASVLESRILPKMTCVTQVLAAGSMGI
jgi:hypothetical protein